MHHPSVLDEENPECLVPGVAEHLGQFGQALRAIYSLAGEGLATCPLDAVCDAKADEGRDSTWYGATSPPHRVSGGKSGSTSCRSSIVWLSGFLSASIA